MGVQLQVGELSDALGHQLREKSREGRGRGNQESERERDRWGRCVKLSERKVGNGLNRGTGGESRGRGDRRGRERGMKCICHQNQVALSTSQEFWSARHACIHNETHPIQ